MNRVGGLAATPPQTLLGVPVDAARPLTGGDVAHTYGCRLRDGREVVAKVETASTRGRAGFGHEADSLRWLGAHGLPVAEVLDVSPTLLVLAHVPTVRQTSGAVKAFARQLAETHRRVEVEIGWPRDHTLASLHQPGPGPGDWGAYFHERRILSMLEQLEGRGDLDRAWLDQLHLAARRLPELVQDDEPMVPLHGDLWWGNLLWSPAGAVLIDPASYGGHREVDLAMLSLFGGPWEVFERAYTDVWPLRQGWERRRRAYQLYPLLVHVALFGGGYADQALQAARATL